MRALTYAVIICLLGIAVPHVTGDEVQQAPAAQQPPAEQASLEAMNHETYERETLEIGDCVEHSGVFTYPAIQAEPYLPPGFEATGSSGQDLPGDRASLVIMVLDCEGPAPDARSTQWFVWLVVDPPEAYTNDDAALHYLQVRAVTTSETLHQQMDAWGISNLLLGDVELEGAPGAPGLDAWQTTADDGSGSATMRSRAVGDHPELAPGTIRIFGVEDGEVTGMVDAVSSAWEGAVLDATLENHGLVPIALDPVGVSYHGWFIDYEITPAEIPGSPGT